MAIRSHAASRNASQHSGYELDYFRDSAVVLIPLILCLLLSSGLFDWLIDDAGISFVYSRNVAAGHGFVPQPGMDPVEGFSNFLWVLLMVPFFAVGLFDPFITSKVVSLLLIGLTFFFLHRSMMILTGGKRLVSLFALLFLAANASFVIWTNSGLENPLYAMLCALLLYLILRNISIEDTSPWAAAGIGVTASTLALTRPDGLVFAVGYPFVLLACGLSAKMRPGVALSNLWKYGVALVGILGAFVIFRLLYFGDIMPNTYYVKGGPGMQEVMDLLTMKEAYLLKLVALLKSIFGAGIWVLIPIGVLILPIVPPGKNEHRTYDIALLLLLALAASAYLLLGRDYMGEFRFATTFFVLIYTALGVAIHRLLSPGIWTPSAKAVAVCLVLAAFGYSAYAAHKPRYQTFYKHPTVSFTRITNAYGLRFNRISEFLELENASFLVPDIGGTLYYSNLRIYDLAGLCDTTIARTRAHNLPAFHEYVFETLKPTLIHTHGYFTAVSRLDEDERFVRDYVPIKLFDDEYAKKWLKREVLSGDFVRKSAVEAVPDKLKQLQDGTAGI